MTRCPDCGEDDTRIVRGRANALRAVASVLLLPFYLLGGLAGDQRGPFLPLERRCPSCGHRFRGRSILDDLTVRKTGSRPRPDRDG